MTQKVNNRSVLTGTLWKFLERISSQLVSFFVSVVLARLLMPADYGVISTVNIFITIAEVFVSSGLGSALIQRKECSDDDFSNMFWFNLLFSIITYFIIFIISPLIAKFYTNESLTLILRVLALRLIVSGINSIQLAYISKQLNFKKSFYSTLFGTIVSAIIGIYMAYAGYGVWALVFQALSNSIVNVLVLFMVIEWKPKFYLSLSKIKPMFNYGWKLLLTDLLGQIFNQLNSFIIGKKYSSSDLAYYSQGIKIPDLLNSNITTSLQQVLFPVMSKAERDEEIISLRKNCLKMTSYILFPILVGIYAVADNMIITLYTEKWALAIPYVRIMCIASVIGVFSATSIQETKAIGRSDMTLKMELIKKPIYLIVAIIAMRFGTIGIAYTLVIDGIIATIFNIYPVKKLIGFNIKEHLLDILPSFLMACIMGVIVYCLRFAISNPTICLMVQIVTGAIIYVLLSFITKNETLYYLISLIKNK